MVFRSSFVLTISTFGLIWVASACSSSFERAETIRREHRVQNEPRFVRDAVRSALIQHGFEVVVVDERTLDGVSVGADIRVYLFNDSYSISLLRNKRYASQLDVDSGDELIASAYHDRVEAVYEAIEAELDIAESSRPLTIRNEAIAGAHSPEVIRTSLLRSLKRLRYDVESFDDSTIVANYKRGYLRLKITFDQGGYHMTHLSSDSRFNRRFTEQGDERIDSKYERMLSRIAKIVTREFPDVNEEAMAQDLRMAEAKSTKVHVVAPPTQAFGGESVGQSQMNTARSGPQNLATSGLGAIVFHNKYSDTINGIYLRRRGRSGWGTNQISQTIPQGAKTRQTGIAPGRYDVRVTNVYDKQGRWDNVLVRGDQTYVLEF